MRKLFRSYCCFVLLSGIALPVRAGETTRIDGSQSSVTFAVHQFLGLTHGKFTQLSGTVELDRAHPERSSVQAVIAVQSIDTGIAKRDEHLRSASFFDAVKYPQIIFKSRRVKQTGPQTGDIVGDLTMHGVTRPITLHVQALSTSESSDGKPMRWSIHLDPIKRSDYGLLFSALQEMISGIAQEVTVEIDVQTRRQAE